MGAGDWEVGVWVCGLQGSGGGGGSRVLGLELPRWFGLDRPSHNRTPIPLSLLLPAPFRSFVVGAGQGVAPSAVVDIVARTVPVSGRASATTTSFGGLHLGTVVGLLAAPPIVNSLGWQALFYIYGGLGELSVVRWWLAGGVRLGEVGDCFMLWERVVAGAQTV